MPDLFDQFWAAYPPRNGKKVGKAETARRFANLSPADQALCIQAAQYYAQSDRIKKDPERFIRNGKGDEPWREWLEPEVVERTPEVPVIQQCEIHGCERRKSLNYPGYCSYTHYRQGKGRL